MSNLSALIVGLVFGLGLLLSGMANPAKILGFLDLAGAWDPSLALVMVGSIAVAAPGFALARRKGRSLLGGALCLPAAGRPDRRLVLGSFAFGVGWGLAGFCPGPALVGLGLLNGKALVFVAAMLAGMAGFEALERWRGRSSASPANAAGASGE